MRAIGSRACPGFTLLEMLVTLVIVSMIGLILSQAMFQIGRVEQILAGNQLQSMAVGLRTEWLRNALNGIVPGQQGQAERFAGEAAELRGLSTAVPQYPMPGVAPMKLSLHFNPTQGQTELRLEEFYVGTGEASAKHRPAVVLLRWPGSKGKFSYQDTQGQIHDSWPPSSSMSTRTPALPALVLLETGLPELPQLIAAPRAADVQLPTRRVLESM